MIIRKFKRHILISPLLVIIITFSGCDKRIKTNDSTGITLFSLIKSDRSKITFKNIVENTRQYNTYMYRNFYNGAGVGLGDINNDGLIDIYLCGNISDNKLYLNKGNFRFEDITEKAGVGCSGVWSTGVTMADINGDGWLDIYVCQSGVLAGLDRYRQMMTKYNVLFINNGDGTFTNRSTQYGVNHTGSSVHAAFFDFDKDGDLDMYLLNTSPRTTGVFNRSGGLRNIREPFGGNMLYRNDGDHFTDITEQAGIYSSIIGFGLGVSIEDLNHDDWPDIYVSNDFFERDYMYINNHDGTFSEKIKDFTRELSFGSMGSDIADINNDGYPEIMVTEMTPEPEARYKTKTVFQSWDEYKSALDSGYWRQFSRNVLQLNNMNDSFSEIGRFAGVSTTDWSWGAIIFDMDNDGWKDIFIANGIYRDLLDQDYLDFYYNNSGTTRGPVTGKKFSILDMLNNMPSVPVPNYAFRNNTDLTFKNMAPKWGLALPSFSNGAAFGDLDNDGDLDLVVNNVNMSPFLYKNLASEKLSNNFIGFILKGDGKNLFATGSRITVFCEHDKFTQVIMPSRGFESSSDNRGLIGIGQYQKVDSVIIRWTDQKISILHNPDINRYLPVDIKDAVTKDKTFHPAIVDSVFFKNISDSRILSYRHRENSFDDFKVSPLLFQMVSNEGPKMAIGDINHDGKDDLIIGGAMNQPTAVYIQDDEGRFKHIVNSGLENDSLSVDTDCILFDADNDGDSDLLITSGGYEFTSGSRALANRLYINNGSGKFTKSRQSLPSSGFESSSCAESCDFDGDGDQDLAIGTRLRSGKYGMPAGVYIFRNDGNGNFSDVTGELAPALINIGMVTCLTWADINNDGKEDLVIAGEYMPVSVFINEGDKFEDKTASFGLAESNGLWHSMETADLDHDGDIDLIVGNLGLNSRIKASPEKPVTLYVSDFDKNGTVEQILCRYNGDKSYPFVMKNDLVKQIPSLGHKYPTFDSYKDQTIDSIFSRIQLDGAVKNKAYLLASSVLINNGNGTFTIHNLPAEAQFTPIYAIHIMDINNDGNPDMLLGGNQYRVKPEIGIYDGSYGITLCGTGNGSFKTLNYNQSGFFVKGEIRDIEELKSGSQNYIMVAVNNDKITVFREKR